MTSDLGRITKLDVRDVWRHEAADFTPWMARPENLAQLGAALGMELELEDTEVAAGPFSADLLARETDTEELVVVENQLEKTNHDHLGKAITYAAVLGASTVVWVSPRFTEEHRQALDWLNEHSVDSIAFFGVMPELWQIDQSRPAIRFSVVARPNEAVRRVAIARPGLSEAKRTQLDWWTRFRDLLVERGVVQSTQSPRPRYWFNVALGRTGIHLSNTANTYENTIGVRVYISNRGGAAEAILQQLRRDRVAIESEVECELAWDPNPDSADKTVAVVRAADLSDPASWDAELEWMVETTRRFLAAFRPRVRTLDLSAT